MGPGEDYWEQLRRSRAAVPFHSFVYGAISFVTFAAAELYGQSQFGLTGKGLYVIQCLIFSLGLPLVVAVHELGHSGAALAVGFRLRSLNIGPLTIHWSPNGGWRHKFEVRRVFYTGGYAGAVPDSDIQVRSRATLMVLAGPFSSLLAALCLWLWCLSVRGTAWESTWHSAAILAALFVGDFCTNLMPVGYSDGTMLWHLVLWTEQGKILYAKHRTATTADDAAKESHNFNLSKALELRRNAVEQILTRRAGPSAELAHAYQELGSTQYQMDDHRAAEASVKTAIEIIESISRVPPALETQTWLSMHLIQRSLFQAGGAQHAYEKLLGACERLKTAERTPAVQAEIGMIAAQAHVLQDHFELALAEIEPAFERIPDSDKYTRLRARLWILRANCESNLGNAARAAEAIAAAEQVLHPSNAPESERASQLTSLVALGMAIADAGRVDAAVTAIQRSASGMEQLGLPGQAAHFRVWAAAYLRFAGRLGEAEAALPAETCVAEWHRDQFLAERGQISLGLDRPEDAIRDLEEVVRNSNQPLDTAIAQALLSSGYVCAGRLQEARELAQAAGSFLTPRHHPGAAGALLTLALVAWKEDEASARGYFEEAMGALVSGPFFDRAVAARGLDQLARELEMAGRIGEAREARQAALSHWSFLAGEQRIHFA